MLGVAGAHEEYDRRGIRGAVVGQPGLPVGSGQPLGGNGIDIIAKPERHDVGLQAIDHGPRLLAGAAMAHLDGDGLPGVGFPLGGEGRVDCFVELACRIIGYVEQLDPATLASLLIAAAGAAGQRHEDQRGQREQYRASRHGYLLNLKDPPLLLSVPLSLR